MRTRVDASSERSQDVPQVQVTLVGYSKTGTNQRQSANRVKKKKAGIHFHWLSAYKGGDVQ